MSELLRVLPIEGTIPTLDEDTEMESTVSVGGELWVALVDGKGEQTTRVDCNQEGVHCPARCLIKCLANYPGSPTDITEMLTVGTFCGRHITRENLIQELRAQR